MEQNIDRSHLPLRMVARVIIKKEGRILLGQVRVNGMTVCYNFPGGGVEENHTAEETVAKESLEEVGVVITNIRPLGVNLPAEHPMGKKREHLFRGTDNHYYVADFVRYDKSQLNSEGDEMPFTWERPEGAIQRMEAKPDPFNAIRILAIQAL
jgi:8-oxo-dGTP pyrophosphatase MutT (NUDIX family)